MRCLVVVALLLAATDAQAIDRPCDEGKIWDPNQGACVKAQDAPKLSAQEIYYRALKVLERKRGTRRAIPLLRAACKKSHGPACTQLGYVFKTGRHVDADPARSLASYSRGCELEDIPGCLGAAEHHAKALGGTSNFAKAHSFWESACKLSSGTGCFRAAEAFQLGRGVKKDEKRAQKNFKRAVILLDKECRGDAGPSCYLLGLAIRDSRGIKASAPRAFAVFARGCDAGSGDACYQKGLAHRDGRGTQKDRAAALRVFKDACARYDSGDSCFAAGTLMASRKLDEDEKKTLSELGNRACELDHKHCLLLARLIDTGVIKSSSASRALDLANDACEHGNGLACFDTALKMIEGAERHRDPVRGIARMKRACDLDYAMACEQLAIYHETGQHLKKSDSSSHKLRAQACILGYGPSCSEGGRMALSGRGLQEGKGDAGKALAFFQLGCRLGEGESCIEAGHYYQRGLGGRTSQKDAERYYLSACKAEYAEGCVLLGNIQLAGSPGRKKDRAKARHWFQEACRNGHESSCGWAVALSTKAEASVAKTIDDSCNRASPNEGACMVLAKQLVVGGQLFPRNERRAFRIVEPACTERRYHPACVYLSTLYRTGIGTLRDPEHAKQLLIDMCKQDVANACTNLAHTYLNSKSYRAAMPLYRRACSDGDPSACNNYAYAHYTGVGSSWSVAISIEYWRKACDAGNGTGCANLGHVYEHGIGVRRSLQTAESLYRRSCSLSEVAGCGPLGRLELARAQNSELAQKNAVEFLQRACSSNVHPDPVACRELVTYFRTTAKPAVPKPSSTHLSRLAQSAYDIARDNADSNPYYAYLLGTFHRDGFAAIKSRKRATELFEQSCNGYDPNGCIAAASQFTNRNPQRAGVYLQRACAAGMQSACTAAELAAENDQSIVPLRPKKGAPSCACRATELSSGWAPLVLISLLGVGRRRRRQHHCR